MELNKLKQVVCINLGFHLWSARRKLSIGDLKIVDGEVPPDDLASLGSKKICNPEDLADFTNLKKEAERKCARVGIKFLGGFAIPEGKVNDLAVELDEIVSKFYAKKATFIAQYDSLIADWVASHPGWERIIQESALDSHTVEGKINASWQAYKILEAQEAQDANLASPVIRGLATAAAGLAGQMYAEIARAAEEVREVSLNGRDRVTQKILSPIRTIRDKLEGLAFLDGRVRPLVETINHVLTQLPLSGPIDGLGLVALQGLVFILADEQRMQAHGEQILAGSKVEDAFALHVPKPVQPKAVEQSEPIGFNLFDVPQVTSPLIPEDVVRGQDVQMPVAMPVSSTQPIPTPVTSGAGNLADLFSF